jgi:F-type H+-transporting ATPase subunit a
MIEIHIASEELYKIGNFIITNSLFSSFLVSVFLIFLALLIRFRIKNNPDYFQNFFELIFEKILNWMDSVLMNRSLSEKYFPIIATIFIFVLLSNWMGLLPGVGSIGIKHDHFVSFLRPPTTDLNLTIALAIISVVSVNFLASLALGVKRHFSKFFQFKNPIFSFVGLLEFLSEFVKILSFSFRLFGNMFAGKVLLLIIVFLVPYIIPLPFMILELFVGFIQAFIFAKLTLVFIAISTSEEKEH